LIGDMVHGATRWEDAVNCMHCHRSAGHGDSVGMGKMDPQISILSEPMRP